MPWVYVMSCEARPGVCRVGFHTTSHEQRQREVFTGSGERWLVAHSVELPSELHARAIEAVAHHYLAEAELVARTATGKNMQVFRCSADRAIKAVNEAAAAVKKGRISAV